MAKKSAKPSKKARTKMEDLPTGPKAKNVKGGYKLDRCFVKSWSTSGDA